MKILIVDDEKISRRILTQKVKGLGTCVVVDSSREALKALDLAEKQGEKFDLITLDVSMPEMGGPQVLRLIRKQEIQNKIPKEERIKVLMVTARMNIRTIKECIRMGCNGYLVKPVGRLQLLQSLEKMGFDTKPAMEASTEEKGPTSAVADIISRFYAGQIGLPVFPHVVSEVQELLGRKVPPAMAELAEVINKDIVIASKLIAIANSPLYRGVDRVDTLNGALLRLGLKTTQGVVSAVASRYLFESRNASFRAQLDKLWLHSFATACLGKQLAEDLGIKNTENVFLMGIVHDIGKMLIMKTYVDMHPDSSLDDSRFQLAVHEIHTTFGAVLLKKMRFSAPFVQVAEFHHWNDFGKEAEKELLIVNLADRLSYEIGFGFLDGMGESDADKVEETDYTQKAKEAQKARDRELNLDSDQAFGLREREEAVRRISGLSSLKLVNLTAEAALAVAAKIQPMIRESAQAF